MNDSTAMATLVPVLVALLLTVGLYVWIALALHAVFRKTGEKGWKAWVPILNGVALLQRAGMSGWWILLSLVPVVSIALYVVMIVACHRLNVGFGHGAGMTVLAALAFPIWASVIGWGSSRWLGESPSGAARVADETSGDDFEAAFGARALPWAFGERAGEPASSAPVAPAPTTAPPAPSAVPAATVAPPAPAVAPVLVAPDPTDVAPVVPDAQSASDAPAALAAPADAVSPAHSPALRVSDAAPRPAALITAMPISAPPISAPPTDAPPTDAPPTDAPPTDAPPTDATPVASSATSGDADGSPWAPPGRNLPRPAQAAASGFAETSGAVSAVAAGTPIGMPMAARSSVSAQGSEPELPVARRPAQPAGTADATPIAPAAPAVDVAAPGEPGFDETVIAVRKRPAWTLTPPEGADVQITQSSLILGRRPVADPTRPHAQLVAISDSTRTMSKTHARLELHEGTWVITDLGSTNGVILIDLDGSEIEIDPGRPMPIIERFLLGDAELSLTRDGA